MAAARASLLEVLTPAAYEHLERLGGRLSQTCEAAFAAIGRPVRASAPGARGGFAFAADPVRDEAAFEAARWPDLESLLWIFAANRGLYLTPARPQNWTISVAHGEAEVDLYVAVVAELCAEVAAT
jgi:glutamate-1-semialdehyde 2,1-aminomutase